MHGFNLFAQPETLTSNFILVETGLQRPLRTGQSPWNVLALLNTEVTPFKRLFIVGKGSVYRTYVSAKSWKELFLGWQRKRVLN